MKPRLLVGATAVAGAFAATGIVAFACIPIATLNLSQSTAQPGSTVTASIHAVSGAKSPPVVFHWQTVDGPVLATVTPADSGTTAQLTIPTVTQSGDYLIIATEPQTTGYETWGMPTRAVIHVDVAGGSGQVSLPAAAPAQTTGAGLSNVSGVSTGVLVLIAVGTLALGLLIVGGATALAGRGAGAAEPVSKS
ncbi:MAG TPA: hypothetical protein VFO60_07205 [Candidatus Dormibacteraeota bacterium]|nr:hypothetical protein [Candidatus Dormibacteraeota bacterium]